METTDKKVNRVIYSYLAIYVIIGIFIAFAAYQYVRNFERHFKANIENQLSTIADLKVHELEHWRNEQRGIAEILFENEAFADIVKRYFKDPENKPVKKEIQVWMEEFQTAFNYDAVILTDPKLVKKIVSPETAELQKAYISPGNIDSLDAGKLVFEDFYRDEFKQKVFLKILIPILNAHLLIGVIELRIDPTTYLYSLLSNWPVPSQTSETLILRREHNNTVYLNELKFQKNAVLNLRIPLENKNVAGVRAVFGQKGFMDDVIDYRGKAVVAYAKKVPNSPWYMVVKEDDSEAYTSHRTDIWLIVLFALGIFLLIGMGLLFLWRYQRIQLYKERIQSAEELQKLNLAIYNSQEIVFMTDKEGIITYINPEFTKEYGYTAEEVVGLNTPRILNSGLHKKEDFELFWHTILNKQTIPKTEYFNKRKDGKLIEIEGSANPVIDQEGNIIGFLGVQRDITVRKRSDLEKQVLYDIIHGVTTTNNFDELLSSIHHSLDKVLYTDNIFVALYDQKTELFSFPYWVDEFDPIPEAVAMRKSLSAYVFRTGEPMLFSQELFEQLKDQNEVELVGSPSPSWIGVPLQTPTRIIGVLVLQHYKKENVYSERDLQFLDSVGSQIAIAIDRRRALERLRESEIKLKVILESTADGILAVDGNGKVIKTNKRLTEMLHIPQSLIDSDDNQAFISFIMNQLTNPDELIAKELKLYRTTDEDLDVLYLKDSRIFERYSVPMILDDSSIGRVWSLRDITEKKHAEEALIESERALKESQKIAALGNYKWNLSTGLWESSEILDHIFGIDDNYERSLQGWTNIIHPDWQEVMSNYVVNNVIEKLQRFDKEYLIVRQDDGQKRWIHGLGELEFDANNQPISLIGTISDISDRKRAEEELKNSQEQLKKFAVHLQNAREQDKILLATQLDNELSQLLVALKMDIGMLKKNVAKGIIDTISADLFAKLDQAHNLIGNSLNNTMKIMNDLRYEVLYLMGFVEAVDLYISEFEKENKISCTFENTILKLDMDEKKATSLFRIFQNAMSSVAENSDATKVKINLYRTDDKLILEIWDNGIGFDPEKSSNEASNRFVYMKERAILLNGKLLVTSLPDKGTSVRVEIPYQN